MQKQKKTKNAAKYLLNLAKKSPKPPKMSKSSKK